MIKPSAYFMFLIVMFLLVSCAAPATPLPLPTQTSTSAPTSPPTATETPAPTPTATPADIEISSIPGFEDWSINIPSAVDVQEQDGALVLTLKRNVLWYMDRQGALAYTSVAGDFNMTADVYTMKRSDPSQAPGGDGTVQLGGLMARNGTGGEENYVFLVVGDDGDGISVETKNTVDDLSQYDGPAWDSANASLRLCRSGQTFKLYKRHIGSDEAWTLAGSFDRPDLPESLQVGVNIYTNSAPDLQIRYEDIHIEPLASSADCEVD